MAPIYIIQTTKIAKIYDNKAVYRYYTVNWNDPYREDL